MLLLACKQCFGKDRRVLLSSRQSRAESTVTQGRREMLAFRDARVASCASARASFLNPQAHRPVEPALREFTIRTMLSASSANCLSKSDCAVRRSGRSVGASGSSVDGCSSSLLSQGRTRRILQRPHRHERDGQGALVERIPTGVGIWTSASNVTPGFRKCIG